MKYFSVYLLFFGLFSSSVFAQSNGDTTYHFPKDQYDDLTLNWSEDLDFTYGIDHFEIKLIRGDTLLLIDAQDTFHLKFEKLDKDRSRIKYTSPNSFLTKALFLNACVVDDWDAEHIPEVRGIYNFSSRSLEVENCEEIENFLQKHIGLSNNCLDSIKTNSYFAGYIDSYLSSCNDMGRAFMKRLQDILFYDSWIIPVGDSISYSVHNDFMGKTITTTYATILIAQDENSKTYQHKQFINFSQVKSSLDKQIERNQEEVEMDKVLNEILEDFNVEKDYKIISVNHKNQLLFFGTKASFGKEGSSRRLVEKLNIKAINK